MRLTPDERELIVTATDAEHEFTVFCDSARFRGRLLKVCRQLGIAPVPRGAGFEVRLPLGAVRFTVPRKATAAQRKALERARQKAKSGAGGPVEIGSPAGRRADGCPDAF